jgi:hypothetical protein
MEKIIEVKDIHYKSGYVYRITFNDGISLTLTPYTAQSH